MKSAELEHKYFEMFARDYLLPEGTVKLGDKPDIILCGARTIGIEITNFYLEDGSLPESEQRQKRVREAVVAEAQAIYQGPDAGKPELTICFNAAVPIRDHNNLAGRITELATKIAEVVTKIDPSVIGDLRRDAFRHIPELSSVYINRIRDDNIRWRSQLVHRGVHMSPEKLWEIIREKEGKLREYQPCDAYWLLIIMDFFDNAQDQEIPKDALKDVSSQVFEKIILYKTCFGSVVETP